MSKTQVFWALVALVLVVDVVTIVFDLFAPGVRVATTAVLALVLLAFGALRLLEWKQMREHQRSAYEVLARHRATRT